MSVARVVVRPVRVVEEGGLVLESHAVEWLKVSVLRLEGNVPPFVICLSGREQKDKTTDPRRHVGELQRPPIVACRDLLCLARTTMSAIRYKPHLTPMCYNLLPPSSLPVRGGNSSQNGRTVAHLLHNRSPAVSLLLPPALSSPLETRSQEDSERRR